jgi:hypothetical protein
VVAEDHDDAGARGKQRVIARPISLKDGTRGGLVGALGRPMVW